MTGITKAVVCAILSVDGAYKRTGKSSLCGGSRFSLSISEWSFTICPMPYNHKQNVLCASLNKKMSSFHPHCYCCYYYYFKKCWGVCVCVSGWL